MSGWCFQSWEKVQREPLPHEPFMKYLGMGDILTRDNCSTRLASSTLAHNNTHLHRTFPVDLAILEREISLWDLALPGTKQRGEGV